jgi:hypothetical protein
MMRMRALTGLVLSLATAAMFFGPVAWGQSRPAPPRAAERAAPDRPGWSVDARSGCWVWNPRPRASETVSWSGACGPDGRATGRGVLEWRAPDGVTRYEGEYRGGKKNGWGVITWASGLRYEGEWHDNKPNGPGAVISDGERYEGDWRNGCSRSGERRYSLGVPLATCP